MVNINWPFWLLLRRASNHRPLPYILQWKERKILAMGVPPAWSSSVSLDPRRLRETRTKSNSENDPGGLFQYNYRAEALPPKSPDPVPRSHMVRSQSGRHRSQLKALSPPPTTTFGRRVQHLEAGFCADFDNAGLLTRGMRASSV